MALSKRELFGLPLLAIPAAVEAAPIKVIDDITMGVGVHANRKMFLESLFQTTKKTWQAYYRDRSGSTQLWMDITFAEAMLLEPMIGTATITVPLHD